MLFCQKSLFCTFFIGLKIRRRKKKSSHETSQTSAQIWKGEVSTFSNREGLMFLLEVKRLKKIEHFYLSQPITLHPQNYIFLSPHLSRVTGNIYLFLSLCLVISFFSYPSVYPPNKVVPIFFYFLVYLFHINLNLFLSFSVSFMTEDSYLPQKKITWTVETLDEIENEILKKKREGLKGIEN